LQGLFVFIQRLGRHCKVTLCNCLDLGVCCYSFLDLSEIIRCILDLIIERLLLHVIVLLGLEFGLAGAVKLLRRSVK